MKKILLFIIYFITFSFNLFAMDYDSDIIKKLKNMGVYFGDPSENLIVGSGEMYVILHNPTELAFKVMIEKAKEFCIENSGSNYTSNFQKILGRYTAYYSCEIKNHLIDEYKITEEEKFVFLIGYLQ